jgi:hypothetical protein
MRHEVLLFPSSGQTMQAACPMCAEGNRKSHETEDEGKLRSVCDLTSNHTPSYLETDHVILLKWAIEM